MAENLQTKPPVATSYLLSYPAPHVLLVTINRPKQRNALTNKAHWEGHAIFRWFDNEPSLRVAVITGAGDKAFCAGQDLIEQSTLASAAASSSSSSDSPGLAHPPTGFMGVSRRRGKKPILAAVNGYALGGGFEICLNCDLVVASPTAQFGLPEAQVGLYAAAGGLPRIIRNCGLQVASEIALTCRRLSAQEALGYHLINKISQTLESVVDETVALAVRIASLSPDAIIITRHGLREAWETASVEGATARTAEEYMEKLFAGENFRIGVNAFAKKTQPKWVPSKL
ncbi:hypothetical protein VTN77DRAFT_1006 [Rasamsonia byssochlamydoides]|uniref:uncharacterized protein n=1 Tax=Rasamsonia byssochlamydoides TaxID=89139 RepID=UPI003744AC8E